MANTVMAAKPARAAGGVLFADLDATLPTSAVDVLGAGVLPAGYISEDGVSETNEHGTEDVVAWGGDKVRTLSTDHTLEYSLTFIEVGNLNLLRLVFGDDNVIVGADGGLTIRKTSHVPPRRAFVFDMIDDGKHLRIVVPNAQVILTGETTYAHGSVMSYEATITAYPDADGVKAFEYREGNTAPVGG